MYFLLHRLPAVWLHLSLPKPLHSVHCWHNSTRISLFKIPHAHHSNIAEYKRASLPSKRDYFSFTHSYDRTQSLYLLGDQTLIQQYPTDQSTLARTVPVGHLANWTMVQPIVDKLISISIGQVLSLHTADKNEPAAVTTEDDSTKASQCPKAVSCPYLIFCCRVVPRCVLNATISTDKCQSCHQNATVPCGLAFVKVWQPDERNSISVKHFQAEQAGSFHAKLPVHDRHFVTEEMAWTEAQATHLLLLEKFHGAARYSKQLQRLDAVRINSTICCGAADMTDSKLSRNERQASQRKDNVHVGKFISCRMHSTTFPRACCTRKWGNTFHSTACQNVKP